MVRDERAFHDFNSIPLFCFRNAACFIGIYHIRDIIIVNVFFNIPRNMDGARLREQVNRGYQMIKDPANWQDLYDIFVS